MGTRGYRLRPKARDDLAEIWQYTATRWSRAQADRYYHAIIDAIEGLVATPELSRDESSLRPGYRSKLCRSHIIYFRVADDLTLDIVRILHQRMDVRTHLPEG